MAKLGKPVEVASYLADRMSLRNRIDKVGIELEGGWATVPVGGRVIRDGSVKGLSANVVHIGELVSAPIKTGKNYEGVFEWVRKFYPYEVNHTCGLHVHMSFQTASNYMQLIRPEYPATIIASIEAWAIRMGLRKDHPLWPRLQGKSEYCQHTFHGEEQLKNNGKDYDKTRSGHRYTVINYAYNRTGTVECRLLPMMDTLDQGLSAIQEVLDVTNAFLVATAERPKKILAEVKNDYPITKEVRDIYVA